MRAMLASILAWVTLTSLHAAPPPPVEQIPAGIEGAHGEPPIRLDPGDIMTTKAKFRPPIEITVVAKTDSTNLRLSYTADQVIFNWEGDPNQLRIEGGPASGKHQMNKGRIPIDKYVTIRWVVTESKESIYVDDDLRFENEADYSKIDRPVTVFNYQSVLKVKSLTTRQLKP